MALGLGMHDLILISGAGALLLAMPGPTNMLLLAAGSTAPLRACLLLLPVVFCAYQIAIWPLVLLHGWLGVWQALAGLTLKSIACGVVLLLAWRLWRRAGKGATGDMPLVSARSVFWVTLFNPKSLVFAFAILPPVTGLGDVTAQVALFAILVAASGVAWIAVGRVMAASPLRQPAAWLGRGIAIVLCLFAVLLAMAAATDATLVVRQA